MTKIKTKAVLFDFDGTLTYGDYNNIWKSLYQVLGYSTDHNSDYYMSYLNFVEGKYDYDAWVKINETDYLNGGLTKTIFDEVSQNEKFIEGLEQVLITLKKKGIKLYVLSGNFGYLIRKTLGDLSLYFDDISANEIVFNDDGTLSHLVATKYDFEGKADYITKIKDELQIDASEICFVGNGENDAFAYRSGAKTICINPVNADEENQEKWTCVLKDVTNLSEILDYIE